MSRMLFKFLIYSFCESALKNRKVKPKAVRKSSLNFNFDQGSCLISDFARPNSNKVVLAQVFLIFEIVILFCILYDEFFP